MAYIANKPVRFDRDYKIGEAIPEGVIAPGMTRKLLEMGRILQVDLPAPGSSTGDHPVSAPEGTEDAPDSAEFVCEVCGKAFKSQNALAAHSRSHKD